jgi:hypothetical protein
MNIEKLRGKFANEKGEVIDPPAEGESFVIRAGLWPNPHLGARQARCSFCKNFVGISPEGWALHVEYPEGRPILCSPCFAEVLELLHELGETELIERLDR